MEEKKYPLKLNSDYYVVIANDLIKGYQRMSLREAQLLFIAISQVVKEDKDFKTYTTSVAELARFMNVSADVLYRDLQGICKSLVQRYVEIEGDKTSHNEYDWEYFHWVEKASYKRGKLTIRLSDDIKPFLLELNNYYSQTKLGTLLSFNSYYAVRLFQYLKADAGAKWGDVEEWYFSCNEIRKMFQIKENQYKKTKDMLNKTIKAALKELENTDFTYVWNYEEHKESTSGNPIVGVSFKAVFFENKEEKEFFVDRVIGQLQEDY